MYTIKFGSWSLGPDKVLCPCCNKWTIAEGLAVRIDNSAGPITCQNCNETYSVVLDGYGSLPRQFKAST